MSVGLTAASLSRCFTTAGGDAETGGDLLDAEAFLFI
jgi:hypothetical protein